MSSSILLVNPGEISAIGSHRLPCCTGETKAFGLPGTIYRKSWIDMDWPAKRSWRGKCDPSCNQELEHGTKKRGTNMALNEPQKMASLPTEKLVGDKYTQPARRVASNLGSLSHFVHSAMIFSAPFIWEHEMGLYPSCICRFAIPYIKV